MDRESYHKSEQALLNEYKGNLFEYLVGNELAQLFNVQENFILDLPDQYRAMFSIQERFIRDRFPKLVTDLPALAKLMAQKIYEVAGLNTISKVVLLGKSNNSFALGSDLGSADLLIDGDQKIPVSLKLSKDSAFVNTRSGGIKSFIEKYFPFGAGKQFQRELNQQLDREFNQAAFDLHNFHDIEYDQNFENWRAMNLSELPGQLGTSERKILHSLYCSLAQSLQYFLYQLYCDDSSKFFMSLHAIMGLGSSNMLQAICFYHNRDGNYELGHLYCAKDSTNELLGNKITFDPAPTQTASFEIQLLNKLLQIRVKPMNKFTSKAFKINCSVKYLNQLF